MTNGTMRLFINNNGPCTAEDKRKSAEEFSYIFFHRAGGTGWFCISLIKSSTEAFIWSRTSRACCSLSSSLPPNLEGSGKDQFIFLCMPGKTGQRSEPSLSQTVITYLKVLPALK